LKVSKVSPLAPDSTVVIEALMLTLFKVITTSGSV
jgi:hypothetical protein